MTVTHKRPGICMIAHLTRSHNPNLARGTTGVYLPRRNADTIFMHHRSRLAGEMQLNDVSTVAPVIVSRQPILDHVEKIVGFELLTPASPHPDEATASVLAQAIADIGLQRLVGSRPAHVDVTRDFLLTLRPLPLSPDRVVLELAVDEEVDDELLAVLAETREAGFRLALDGFAEDSPLLEHVDAVKLDVSALEEHAIE